MVTSEHSQAMLFDPGSLGESASTSSLVGFHANRGLWPGSEWAKRMTVISGQRCAASLPKSDPLGYSLRMLLESSIWGSMTCYLTWKKSVTPHGRLLFRLVPSTPRTAGIGSGLWPTPRLEFDSGRHRGEPDTLHSAVRMWPTPGSADNRDRGNLGIPAIQRRQEIGKQLNLSMVVTDQKGMKLNSAWVSRMMGYPDDWLMLDGEATR